MSIVPPKGLPGIRAVLLDLSGVLYVGNQALAGSKMAVRRLQESGVPIRLITNTTREPRSAIIRKLQQMGFDFAEDQLATAPSAIRSRLEADGRRPLLLVHPDLEPEFFDMTPSDPDVVVLGDMGKDFDYAVLNRAFRLLMEGASLWVMGTNRYFREADGLSLDIGPFVRALEYAAEVEAENFGKPDPRLFHAAIEDLHLDPSEVLMVGDDVAGDIDGARMAGLAACLVRTGKYQQGDEDRALEPGAGVASDLNEVVEALLDLGKTP
ncbi:TIGR01458 family HAD-type hydrolase [Thioalkalivibrio sp. ALJ7]|uniref:TIGR01458 family HAD-type hydrolase n=1 Tax=Thioalkalivibrio sp. ALJ7 TaxID=1158756 RepID=UPI000373F541|nr:TIGR01458 family HAD-type hydrolase [Thioalkalivibrio sp. ALJ7]